MSTTEKMVAELQECWEPMSRELMLADIAKTYGEGFAAHVRQELARPPKEKRR